MLDDICPNPENDFPILILGKILEMMGFLVFAFLEFPPRLRLQKSLLVESFQKIRQFAIFMHIFFIISL